LELARALRDAGMSRGELLALYDSAHARHAGDADPARDEAVLDAMDVIAGWCPPSRSLDPDEPRPGEPNGEGLSARRPPPTPTDAP